MKEQKKLTFLIRFGLGDLEIVGFGTKIIKIGPEMPILEQFVVHVQNIMKSTDFCTFYLLENATFTTSKEVDCGNGYRSKLAKMNQQSYLLHVYASHIQHAGCHTSF